MTALERDQLLLPLIAARGRGALHNAEIDERWLRWIGRFRFVDVRALQLRFGVSDPAAWRRARRLDDAGLLRRQRCGRTTVFFLSPRALRLLDLPKRKPPRASDRDLIHELAIARWTAQLELAGETAGDGLQALTERDMRERHTDKRPYCAFLRGPHGQLQSRWPDVALELPDGKLHIWEIELSDKGTNRLRAIVDAYRAEPRIAQATFLVASPALARRITRLAIDAGARHDVLVQAWPDLSPEAAETVRATIALEVARLF